MCNIGGNFLLVQNDKIIDVLIFVTICLLCMGIVNMFLKKYTVHQIISQEIFSHYKNYQCWGSESGSGSLGSVCFWASRIRILICQSQVRNRILPSSSKNSKKNFDFYCFVTFCDFFSFKSDVNVPVFRIRIHRIRMYLDLPDPLPDPLISGGKDPKIRIPDQNITDPQHCCEMNLAKIF